MKNHSKKDSPISNKTIYTGKPINNHTRINKNLKTFIRAILITKKINSQVIKIIPRIQKLNLNNKNINL